MTWPLRLVATDEEWPATLDQAVHDEIISLWGDLHAAIRDAAGGCWSGRCENLAHRIVALARLVGTVDWTEIDTALIRSNVYTRIHAEAGLWHPPVDWDALVEHERQLSA